MFITHSESPGVEMSMVGVGEEQHFQECPCALLKGGQWYLLSASTALLIPGPPPAPAVSGMRVTCLAPGVEDKHSAGGEGAQVLLPPWFLRLCFG